MCTYLEVINFLSYSEWPIASLGTDCRLVVVRTNTTEDTMGAKNTMTAKDMIALIGTEGAYNVSREMYVMVRIEDARVSYGEVQVLITPLQGYGTCWINVNNVKAV